MRRVFTSVFVASALIPMFVACRPQQDPQPQPQPYANYPPNYGNTGYPAPAYTPQPGYPTAQPYPPATYPPPGPTYTAPPPATAAPPPTATQPASPFPFPIPSNLPSMIPSGLIPGWPAPT